MWCLPLCPDFVLNFLSFLVVVENPWALDSRSSSLRMEQHPDTLYMEYNSEYIYNIHIDP